MFVDAIVHEIFFIARYLIWTIRLWFIIQKGQDNQDLNGLDVNFQFDHGSVYAMEAETFEAFTPPSNLPSEYMKLNFISPASFMEDL